MTETEIREAIEREIKTNKGVRRAHADLVDDAADYLTLISPVDHGDYAHSHRVEHLPDVDGLPEARVVNDDWKRYLIEHGSGGESPTPEFAPYRRTAARYR